MRLHRFPLAAAALLFAAACDRSRSPERAPDALPAGAAARETTQLASRPTQAGNVAAPAAATTAAAMTGAGPSMPRVLAEFCQGESCEKEYPALVCGPVQLRSVAADTAPVVARLVRGDTVQVRQRDLHILEPGRVVIRRAFDLSWEYDMEGGRMARDDTLHFAAGDTVYLLHYLQLGWWVWWHHGHETSGNEFWTGPEEGGDFGSTGPIDSSAVAVALSHPRTADWWRVETRSGQPGWWRADTLYTLSPIGTRFALGGCLDEVRARLR